jgi:ATP-dependent DNA ligase
MTFLLKRGLNLIRELLTTTSTLTKYGLLQNFIPQDPQGLIFFLLEKKFSFMSSKLNLAEINYPFVEKTHKYDIPFEAAFSTLTHIARISGKNSIKLKGAAFDTLLEGLNQFHQKLFYSLYILNGPTGLSKEGARNRLKLYFRDNLHREETLSFHFNTRQRFLDLLANKPFSLPYGIPCFFAGAAPINESELGYPFFWEEKYDGLRRQIHWFNKELKIFSRAFNDITFGFKETAEILKDQPNFILDCELVRFDFRANKILPFTEIAKRHGIKGENVDLPDFKIIVFDILKFQETNMLGMHLQDRKNLLLTLNQTQNFEVRVLKICKTPQEKDKLFKLLFQLNWEGLILKNLNSPYIPGKSTEGWRKIRLDLLKNNTLSLDLLICGISPGKGKRKNTLGALHLCTYTENEYTYFCSVGTGFSDEQLKELTTLFLQHPTTNLKINHFPIKIKNQILFHPFLLREITCSEIFSTNGLYSARFPVFKRIRDDKKLEDRDTIEDIKKLIKPSRLQK